MDARLKKLDADLRLLHGSIRRTIDAAAADEFLARVEAGERAAALEGLLRLIERGGAKVSPAARSEAYAIAERAKLDIEECRRRWPAPPATALLSFENHLKAAIALELEGAAFGLAPSDKLDLSVTAQTGGMGVLTVRPTAVSAVAEGSCRFRAVLKGDRLPGSAQAGEAPGLVRLALVAGEAGLAVAYEPEGFVVVMPAGDRMSLEVVPAGARRALAVHLGDYEGKALLSLWPDHGRYRAAYKGMDIERYVLPK